MPSEDDRATTRGNTCRKFGKVSTWFMRYASRTDKQTNKKVDRQTHIDHNTLHPYWG